MNVIQRAKAQVAQSTQSRTARQHLQREKKKKEGLDEGELVWIGEYSTKDIKAFKLSKGEKTLMSQKEAKLFHRSPYERGFTEYIYEGQLKYFQKKDDPHDPRGATREGQGIMWYPNGTMYEGTWKHDVRHGYGFYGTHTGYKYTGEWDNDITHGKGYETIPQGAAIDGLFVDGKPHGPCTLLYNPQQNTYRYEGEFSNGLRHGKGVIFYENGDTFEGTFDMGKRHGRGISTRTVNGREVQYETMWEQDALVQPPTCIDHVKRIKKPKPSLPFRLQGHLVAADLTKWQVKDDVTELPLDHFMRIKLGFEGLDVHGSGSLATPELAAVWGDGSQEMLAKLDADGNGTVELDEIFAAWYPNVPSHNIHRFMQQNINPRILLRLRGILNGVVDESACGYMQVCGITTADKEEDVPLQLRFLENSQYKIGMEKFTAANYAAAKILCDPPHFLEVLEVWYPNIPRTTLERYEAFSVDASELALIKIDFFRLSRNDLHLLIEEFEDAQGRWQSRISLKHEKLEMIRIEEQNAIAMGLPVPKHKSLAEIEAEVDRDQPLEGPIQLEMEAGFFKDQPVWKIGNSIRLSVFMLKDIDKFETRLQGSLSLQQILRYCFPNARCKKMQELLQKKRPGQVHCVCAICNVV